MDRFQMCQLSNVSGWPFAEANLSSEVSTFSQPDYDLGQGKGVAELHNVNVFTQTKI